MKRIVAIAAAGVLFSAYRTLFWLIGKECTQGCSLLITMPVCLFGLGMFVAILVAAAVADHDKVALHVIRWVTLIGMLFSLYFAAQELQTCITCYQLWLPDCVYGFILYTVIFTLTFCKLVPFHPRLALTK